MMLRFFLYKLSRLSPRFYFPFADGCVRYNRTYRVGDEFTEGCELRCVCRGNDEGDCKERCLEPYMRAGAMAGDPLCYEKALPEDLCCVSVRCAHGKTGHSHEASGENLTRSQTLIASFLSLHLTSRARLLL